MEPFGRKKRRRSVDPTSKNIGFFDDGDNAFAKSVDAGHRIDPRAQKIFVVCVALVALYAFALIIPKSLLDFELHVGGYTFSMFIADLQSNVGSIVAVLSGVQDGWTKATAYAMTRYVVVALAGAGLALSGAVYQGAFRNALVSPSTLGVMTGGQFGLLLWVVLFGGGTAGVAFLSSAGDAGASAGEYLASSYGLAALSFAGCFVVVGLVLGTVKLAGGGTSGVLMIISGQVVAGVIGIISTTVRYYYMTVDPYGAISELLQGLAVASFYRAFTWIDIVALAVPLAVTFAVVMALRQKMMTLAFDEAEQRAMGIDTRVIQVAVVGLCTLLTAFVISFCGSVGFVGFMVPHLARRLVGPNFKYLLPAATAIGALFVLAAYVLVETTVGSNYTSMTGMYLSIAGAVVFLATALRGEGSQYGTFR